MAKFKIVQEGEHRFVLYEALGPWPLRNWGLVAILNSQEEAETRARDWTAFKVRLDEEQRATPAPRVVGRLNL